MSGLLSWKWSDIACDDDGDDAEGGDVLVTMCDKTKKSRSGKQKEGWIWKDYCRKKKIKETKRK